MAVARLLCSSSTVSFHQSVLSARDVNSRANGSTKGPSPLLSVPRPMGVSDKVLLSPPLAECNLHRRRDFAGWGCDAHARIQLRP